MNTEVILAIIAAMGSVAAGLGTAINVVYQRSVSRTDRLEQKLDECESKHETATKDLQKQSERIGRLEGYMQAKGELSDAQS